MPKGCTANPRIRYYHCLHYMADCRSRGNRIGAKFTKSCKIEPCWGDFQGNGLYLVGRSCLYATFAPGSVLVLRNSPKLSSRACRGDRTLQTLPALGRLQPGKWLRPLRQRMRVVAGVGDRDRVIALRGQAMRIGPRRYLRRRYGTFAATASGVLFG